MKTTKIKRWAILLLIISISFGACNNDDDTIILDDTVGDTAGNGDGTNGDGNSVGGTQSGTEGEITLYSVHGNDLTKLVDYQVSGQDLVYQNNVARHQEIWGLTKDIMPIDNRDNMNQFMIYNGEITSSAGYVFPTNNNLTTWQMGIAINYADDQTELVYTVIHEFGHILTLNNTQIDASTNSGSCSNYFIEEGCTKANSYINEIYSLYWADIWTEYQNAQSSESALQAFYDTYRDRFVTNYAVTNPAEDIAEVFTTFVTLDSRPAGTTIAEKKVLLMYNRPELVALRDHIRNNLASGRSTRMLPVAGSWNRANTIGNPHKSYCGVSH